ncbi:mobilization protein BmgA (plasmid) [Leptolyngbya boryana IAM M-101]|nr:mobilization protein BmgA [Leptolyngbya boryana IAM M-101]BAS66775.1 mobilization protein BmgA [Leptolyngbya boryana dg5]
MGYLLRTDKREKGREAENPIFHTNMFGETEQELTEELRFSSDQNGNVDRTYVQYKISFPPGETPDLQTKIGIVDDLLELRNHGQNCQFFAVEHFEKIDKRDVHHIHVLSSTVRLDGTWVDDAYERVKLKDVEREIELKRDLQYCPPKEKGERVNTSIAEVKLKEQGQTLTKDTLRNALDEAVADQPSMPLLMVRIKAQGYTMKFHEFDDGRGVSFGAEGKYFKGRQLGDRFSFNGLYEYAGVDYQPERDDAMLRQLNAMNAQECQALLIQIEQPEQSRQPDLEQKQTGQEVQQQVQLWDAICLVEDIWEHSRAGLPKLKTATFEEYQIQLAPSGHPELHRMGETVLERFDDVYQSNGLTQADLERLQAWQRSVIQQHEERMRHQAAREKKRQQKGSQNQQTTTQPERVEPPLPKGLPEKSQEIEL